MSTSDSSESVPPPQTSPSNTDVFTEEQLENLLLESNYLSTLKKGIELEYFGLFIQIIDEYMKYVSSALHIHDPIYKNYVICRGIQSLHHIFNHLLFYTKNIHLVVHHLQKAICLYVEFNGQIKIDTNEFLKLTSNDSIMFLYKKTIFAMNTDKKKAQKISPRERELLTELHTYTQSFVDILITILTESNSRLQNTTTTVEKSVENSVKNKVLSTKIDAPPVNVSLKGPPSYKNENPFIYYIIQCFKYVIVVSTANRPTKQSWLKHIVSETNKNMTKVLGWINMFHYMNTASTEASPSHTIHELIRVFTETPDFIEPSD